MCKCKFKVGDKVRIVKLPGCPWGRKVGDVFIVKSADDIYVRAEANLPPYNQDDPYFHDDLELVEGACSGHVADIPSPQHIADAQAALKVLEKKLDEAEAEYRKANDALDKLLTQVKKAYGL